MKSYAALEITTVCSGSDYAAQSKKEQSAFLSKRFVCLDDLKAALSVVRKRADNPQYSADEYYYGVERFLKELEAL